MDSRERENLWLEVAIVSGALMSLERCNQETAKHQSELETLLQLLREKLEVTT